MSGTSLQRKLFIIDDQRAPTLTSLREVFDQRVDVATAAVEHCADLGAFRLQLADAFDKKVKEPVRP